MSEIGKHMVFAVSQTHDGRPLVILGIPRAAWEYMADGKTHTFDLARAGLPVQIMLYGARDHDAAMRVITDYNARLGIAVDDRRREDFSIKPTSELKEPPRNPPNMASAGRRRHD